MAEEMWELKLPADVSQELEELPESRVNQVVSDALREALDLVTDAKERRDELRERMGLSDKDVEELDDDGLTDADKRQAELHRKRWEGR